MLLSLMLDGMAGRHCVFGFGCTPIHESLIASFAEYLGDGSCFANVAGHHLSALSRQLETLFSRSSSVSADSMALLPSPDLAMEYALQLTRRFRAGKSFRTIAMLGSDHGRTGMTRTASGQPELHQGLGPMMAGFSHVPSGDLDALRAAIDELGWLSETSLENRWPHNASHERFHGVLKEAVRSISVQSGFPSSSWHLMFPYAAMSLAVTQLAPVYEWEKDQHGRLKDEFADKDNCTV